MGADVGAVLVIFMLYCTGCGAKVADEFPYSTMAACEKALEKMKIEAPTAGDAEAVAIVFCREANSGG